MKSEFGKSLEKPLGKCANLEKHKKCCKMRIDLQNSTSILLNCFINCLLVGTMDVLQKLHAMYYRKLRVLLISTPSMVHMRRYASDLALEWKSGQINLSVLWTRSLFQKYALVCWMYIAEASHRTIAWLQKKSCLLTDWPSNWKAIYGKSDGITDFNSLRLSADRVCARETQRLNHCNSVGLRTNRISEIVPFGILSRSAATAEIDIPEELAAEDEHWRSPRHEQNREQYREHNSTPAYVLLSV